MALEQIRKLVSKEHVKLTKENIENEGKGHYSPPPPISDKKLQGSSQQ